MFWTKLLSESCSKVKIKSCPKFMKQISTNNIGKKLSGIQRNTGAFG
jgi:hypothetical protein